MHEAWYSPDMLPTMVNGQAFLIIVWQLSSRRHHLSSTWGHTEQLYRFEPWGDLHQYPLKYINKQRHKSSKTQKWQNVSLMEHKPLPFPEHLNSQSVFSCIRVTQSLVFYIVFCIFVYHCMSFSFSVLFYILANVL
jgi:hypothetical protein